jgi:hypothetical protein
MKKIVKLTEAQLAKIVKKIIREQEMGGESEIEDMDLKNLYDYKLELYEMAKDIIGDDVYQYELNELVKKLMETEKRSSRHLAKEILRINNEIKKYRSNEND